MSTIVGDLLKTVDNGVTQFATGASANLAHALAQPFINMLVLYIIIWGLLVLWGTIKEPLTDGVTRIMRIGLIVGIGLNVGVYDTQITKRVFAFPDELSAVVTKSKANSVNAVIDEALERGNEVGIAYKNQGAGWNPMDAWGWYATALIVWMFTGIVCIYATALILVSKIAIGICLALGPLFIITLLFNSMKGLFEGWVRQILTYVAIYVVIAVIINILFTFWLTTLNVAIQDPENGWTSFLPAFLMGGVTLVVLLQAQDIARGLIGGVSISTLNVVGRSFSSGSRGAAAVGSGGFQGGRALGRMLFKSKK